VLDELLQRRDMHLSEARSYLAQYLFRGDDVFKQVSALSGGERGRLALALLALADANFLLLDEPTNHLDIPAQEVLQAVLEHFSGTILLVSHDRYLVDRLATQIWNLDDHGLTVFAGPYRDYQAEREAAQAAPALDSSQNGKPDGRPPDDERSGLSKNELRRLRERVHKLEAEISSTEKKLDDVTAALQAASAAEDVGKIQSLSIEYAAIAKRLEELMAAWEELAHEQGMAG
jgi:ATP-binding cassette subfamily F protein 3